MAQQAYFQRIQNSASNLENLRASLRGKYEDDTFYRRDEFRPDFADYADKTVCTAQAMLDLSPPDGRLRVYRTRDGARSWQPMTRGLPQKDAFETVLRDALCTDTLPRAGVYFGTRSGKLFGSRDGGGRWRAIAAGLPPVLCVRAAVVDGRR